MTAIGSTGEIVMTPPASALSQTVQHVVDTLGFQLKELAHDDASRPTVSRIYAGDAEGISLNGGVGVARRLPVEAAVLLARAWFPMLDHRVPAVSRQIAIDPRPLGARLMNAIVEVGAVQQKQHEEAAVALADGEVSPAELVAMKHLIEQEREALSRFEAVLDQVTTRKSAHTSRDVAGKLG